jgi:hypothetical protein
MNTSGKTTTLLALLVVACGGSQEPAEEPARRAQADAQPTADEVPPAPPPAPPPPPPAPSDPPDAGAASAPASDGGVGLGAVDDEPRRHCVILGLRQETEENAAEVERILVADGYRAARDGAEVAVMVTAEEIQRLFGARIQWSVTGASATSRMVREANLRGGRVPASLRRRVSSFAIGHQICE